MKNREWDGSGFDSGMTAQRRAHRRPAQGREPERTEKVPAADRLADVGMEWLLTPDDRKPETPVTEPRLPEEAEKRKPEEPASPEPEEPKQETPKTEEAKAEELKTEEPKPEALKPEAPETDARDREALSAAARADSRIPPEARRMAAAPYGTAKPEARRPGTRPMVAPKRPAAPETARSAGMSARPAAPGNRMPERAAVRRPEPRKQSVQVGYAPGRMSDGMTRQMNIPDQEQESYYSRDARAYLERRSQPFREKGEGAPPPDRPVPKGLKILVASLLVVGFALGGFVFMKTKKAGAANGPRPAPVIVSFDGPESQEMTAPVDLSFSVVTGNDVNQVRLTDEDGEPVNAVVYDASFAENKGWVIQLHVENGLDSAVRLEVKRDDEEGWIKTDYSSDLVIRSAAGIAATETPPPAAQAEAAGAERTETAPAVTETAPPEEHGQEPDTEGKPPEETETGADEGKPAEGEPEEEMEEDPEAIAAWEDEEIADEPEEGGDDREIGELRTPEPTNTPEPEKAKPTATPPLTVEAAPEANPDKAPATEIYLGTKRKKEKEYSRPAKELIHMPAADEYTTKILGVMTFRGDNFRRNAAVGTLKGDAVSLKVQWEVEGGSARGVGQTYYGYGWPGQPAIARWSKQVRGSSNLYESKQTKEKLREVIIAGLDGSIRFLDLEDGSLTRNSIKLGYPMRGTPSLHTLGEPFISVGQFARKMKVKTGRIGLRQYNLYNMKELKFIDGLDTKGHRTSNNVGSFETSALIDRNSDTLITAGSNGALYLEALNSVFDYNAGVLSFSPSLTMMVTKVKKNSPNTAVESSLAAYDKYVFYADMGGLLRCVDTDTMTTVWAVETGDSVMAAVAMDLTEDRELNLYTANMLNNRKKGDGSIQIRRYDALSGREAWTTDIGVYKGKKDKDDVGAKASPVIGQKGLNGMVYFTVTGLSEDGRSSLGLTDEEPAALIALNKETGKVVWAFGLSSRSESSPVAVYNESGDGWIIQCEQNGKIHLIDGLSGQLANTLTLEAEIEASPAVYDDMMVIGTTGKGTSFIYGIRINID